MKAHILLIDDDEDELKFFTEGLNRVNMPYKCTWANSGGQALKQLAYLKPDIIFLDLRMPEMDGLDCLAAIRQLAHLHDVPIILHSSVMTDDYREKGMRLGATACVLKPVTLEEFAAVLRELHPGEGIVS